MKDETRKAFCGNAKVFIACLAVVAIVALAGSIFTAPSISSGWYERIKPDIVPPNFVFPVAWTALYLLIAVSMYFAWTGAKNKMNAMVPYAINLFLNAFWSYAFFGLRDAAFGFVVLVALWLSIIAMIAAVWKVEKKAAWLLAPYLLWVSFAGILNYLAIGKTA